MVTKTYDGSTTQQLTFDASSSTENILQVSNHTGWSEYRDGDDLVLFSYNANDYLRVFGAYADATRLEYIQYLFDGVSSPKYLVSEIDDVPSSGAHFFAGTSANDVITTSPADPSSATGYLGDDQITGSSGTDYLGGNEGDDILSGGAGDDVLIGGSGNDTLDGGAGDDILEGGDGDDVLRGGDGDDKLSAWIGNDEVYAGAGNDTIINTGGEDLFDGGSGVDTLITDLSQSVKDRLGLSLDFDIVFDLTAEDPHMRHYAVTPDGTDYAWDEIYSIENYTLIGDFDVTLTGDDQANILVSDSGDDVLRGGDGDDKLSAWIGNDEVYAGAGNDTIINTGGEDLFDGGSGVDTLITDLSQSVKDRLGLSLDFDIVFDLTAEDPHMRHYAVTPDGTDYAWDEIYSIENYTLIGDFDVTLTGDDQANILVSDSGDDVLRGGAGNDTLDGGSGDDKLYGGAGNDTLSGGAGDDVYEYWGYEGFDVISETSGFDTIVFKEAHNENAGWGSPFQEGDDLVYVAGNGISGFRVTDHFSDPDKSIELFEYELSGYSVLVRNSDQEIVDPFGNYDELLVGTVGNDTIIGAAGDNIIHDEIYGYGGDDTIDNSVGGKSWIEAGDGDDVVTGGASEDRIRGQGGDDKLSGNDGNDYLFGGAGDDTLDGGAGDDTINDGAGTDIINGGDGTDTLLRNLSDDYSDYAFTPIIDLNSGKFYAEEYPDDYDTLISMENLQVAGNFNYTLKGDNADNILTAGAGDDTLDRWCWQRYANWWFWHDDIIYGGAGDDTYVFEFQGNDTVIDSSGNNIVFADTKGDNGELRFRQLYQSNDQLVLEGSRENTDSKISMSGVESIKWGVIDDGYTMTLGVSGETSDVSNSMYVGTLSDDTLITGQGDYVEGYGADGDDTITVLGGSSWVSGDGGNDTLIGGEGNDTLKGDYTSGDAGHDTLYGNGGNDTLSGNAGNDTLTGGSGSDTFQFHGFFEHDTITDYDSDEDILEFYANDGSALNISDLIETVNSDGNRVLSTADGLSSVTLEGSAGITPVSGGLAMSVVSQDGDVVTFGIFADPITDPDEDGIGSFDFTLNHDALDMQIDAGSLVFATGLSGLQNYDADSGTLTAGAFTLNNVEDLDAPLLTFEATMLDTKAPISIQITDIVVDGDDFASTTEVFDFSALAITTTITDRFGNAMTSAEAQAYEASNGEQFFIREVGDDDGTTVFEIVALPDANISAIDFELTDNAGLTDFTVSDALADWSVQANTSTPNTVILSGFGAIDGSEDITAGQETVLATFTSAASPDFVISGIALNGVSQQNVSVDKITATSTTGNVTVFETASGSDLLIDAAMAIDTASDKAIGAFDALQALRLAVGLDKSDGTSEWHDYIAADINKDGRVGADDALNILKFAVGLTDGPSADWVFVDGDADYSAIDRKNTDYDEGILISDVMTDLSINMTGILVGDVDGSYIA